MHIARRTCVTVDDMPAREWVVKSGLESTPVGDAHRFVAHPIIRGSPAAVAKDHRGYASRRRRHRMAVEQEGAAEPVEQ